MFTNSKLTNISHTQLNAKCLVQISKFARMIHQIDGSVLQLKDDNIIEKIINISEKTTHPELKAISKQLQFEVLDIADNSKLGLPSTQSLKNSNRYNKTQ